MFYTTGHYYFSIYHASGVSFGSAVAPLPPVTSWSLLLPLLRLTPCWVCVFSLLCLAAFFTFGRIMVGLPRAFFPLPDLSLAALSSLRFFLHIQFPLVRPLILMRPLRRLELMLASARTRLTHLLMFGLGLWF